MIDVWNQVTTRLRTALVGVCEDFTSTYMESPAKFPCVFVNQIGNEDLANDLENVENAINSTIELQVYSSKSLYEARRITELTSDEMRRLGYRRIFGAQQIMNVDRGLYRMIARYNRIVGADEQL